MSTIQSNLKQIQDAIPKSVTLVAVSKFHPVESIQEAYETGQRIFGESKVQELIAKEAILPKDIQWHFIGHLQTNKVKYITPFISLIHSVDSIRLLEEINKCAARDKRCIDVLLQIHIANEESKFGFTPENIYQLFKNQSILNLTHIRIRGLMGMATYTDNISQIRSEFRILKTLFSKIKKEFFENTDSFEILSFGMSDDYLIAIEEGSNMVRIGSNIFGVRNY